MTEGELITQLQRELMDLAGNFDADNFADAVDNAERDCGWLLPQTEAFKITWLKSRTKRHLFEFLRTGKYAKSFQYEQIHLEDPFKHFSSLIKEMDDDFKKAMEENPYEFANVSATHIFGTKIDAGFQYDSVGEDLTYSETNKIIFTPTESDD